jgi:hypothetical protein
VTDDYQVKPRSNSEVRRLAKRARAFFNVPDHRHVDVIACLKRPTIWTVTGEKRLNFQVRSNSEMGRSDGQTSYGNGIVTVAVKQSVYSAAVVGDGRARQTHAHELGHAVMHDGPNMARRELGNVTPNWLASEPFKSAEHQAKIFAPNFLINDPVAQTLTSAEAISIEFGISLESARIYFDEMMKERDRPKEAERMLHIADEFRKSVLHNTQEMNYIDEICEHCGKKMLIPLGVRYLCHTCGDVSDRFQDGDIVGF